MEYRKFPVNWETTLWTLGLAKGLVSGVGVSSWYILTHPTDTWYVKLGYYLGSVIFSIALASIGYVGARIGKKRTGE